MRTETDYDVVAAKVIAAPEMGAGQTASVQIMPWGEFAVNGQPSRLTEESLPLIEQFLAARGVDIPLDYDHGCFDNPPANGIALAAGWVRKLHLEKGQPLRADVEYTPKAAAHVRAKEFRYLSPTFFRRKSDGVVIGLHSVALTNTPAIAGMPPIAARSNAADAAAERIAAMKTIAQCLGLAAEATEEQIAAKIEELKVSASQAGQLREGVLVFANEIGDAALAATVKDGKLEVVSASLKTAALKLKNPPGMVAKAEYEALAAKVKTLEEERAAEQCAALISAHAKKLPPARHEWFKKFYAADPVAAREWIDQAPELVATKPISAGGGAGGTGREAAIVAARARFAEGGNWGSRSEREFVNGTLLAGGHRALSDEEAGKLGV